MCEVTLKKQMGTAAVFRRHCRLCSQHREWSSQRQSNRISIGNLLLAPSLFVAGGSPIKVVSMLNFMSVAVFSIWTYFAYQRSYTVRAVCRVWDRHPLGFCCSFYSRKWPDATLWWCGCDSPGHNAKYGTYSLMDMARIIIHDVVLVQVHNCQYWVTLKTIFLDKYSCNAIHIRKRNGPRNIYIIATRQSHHNDGITISLLQWINTRCHVVIRYITTYFRAIQTCHFSYIIEVVTYDMYPDKRASSCLKTTNHDTMNI